MNCLVVIAGLLMPFALAGQMPVRVVDGLGRPVEGVTVRFYCVGDGKRQTVLRLESDTGGWVNGFDPADCREARVSLEKEGYESFAKMLRDRYVLRRKLEREDTERVAALQGEPLRKELREVMAADWDDDWDTVEEWLLMEEARLRPALRDLVVDAELGAGAQSVLAMIGAEEDRRLILGRSAGGPELEESWRYSVAASLVNPAAEAEWEFLRRCAAGEYEEPWVDAAAIRTLKLTGTPRAREILAGAQKTNARRARSIAGILQRWEDPRAPLNGADLGLLARSVADALGVGNVVETGPARLNRAGDRALVPIVCIAGGDRLTYSATFQRQGKVWGLRGVRDVAQAHLPPPPVAAAAK